MVKRLLAGPLWFLATLTAYSMAAWFLGAPGEVGPILGLVVATLVVLDPADLIWSPVEPLAETTPSRATPVRTGTASPTASATPSTAGALLANAKPAD